MLTRITPPAVAVLSLQEIKTHLRLDHAVEDEYLQNLIQTATEWVENYTGRALITQTWQKTIYPGRDEMYVNCPYLPFQGIVSAMSLTTQGRVPIKPYQILGERVSFGWLSVPIEVAFRCGYGDRPLSVPAVLRHGVMLVAAHLYEHRDDGMTKEHAMIRNLLNPFRVMRIQS